MQIIDVTAELEGVSFAPGNELEEILQNVRTILTTMRAAFRWTEISGWMARFWTGR